MKEVLTKGFWQGVKNTFHEALQGPPPREKTLQAPAEGSPKTEGQGAADAEALRSAVRPAER